MKSWIVAVCERLGQQLQDHRAPSKVQTSQLRTLMIQQAQGWDDLSDTGLLSEAPVFQLACSDQRSTTLLTQQRPSQPTLSRLLNLLAQDANRAVLHDGLLELAMWRLSSMRGGKPLRSITLDVDGLSIETFGNQASMPAASITDINIAFCRTHDGISHVLRNTFACVRGKAANEWKPGWILPETASFSAHE